MRTITCRELETEMVSAKYADGRGADCRLPFEVVPDVIEEHRRLVIRGRLSNVHPEPRRIIVLPVGMMGFTVRFAPTEAMTYVGPSFPPPAPPPPVKIVIPAETRVEFTGFIIKQAAKSPEAETGSPPAPVPVSRPDALSLEDYDYSGTPCVAVEWSFCYWRGDRPSGIIPVTIPARD